ncbi:MAG TPA: hypothetical protein VKV02_12760 [Acidobacteriaceae bacterium]|nr:hypothetical protein [Acidobacteriaceae bacterium]
MRTYLYKLTSDRGGAPCAPPPPPGAGPLLSLAICKPAIRRTAEPGDRILGLTSRVLEQRDGYPPVSIIYAAVVTDVLDATRYYGPRSPHRHRPDCIYGYDEATGELLHTGRTGLHADPRHRRRDLGREGLYENARILLSDQFTYLGQEALVVPESLNRLRELASALGQGHRVIPSGKDASLDRELATLFRRLGKLETRFTPQEVHADAYDHPAPGPADRCLPQRSMPTCRL